MHPTVIVALIGVAGGLSGTALVALITAIFRRSVVRADAAHTLVESGIELTHEWQAGYERQAVTLTDLLRRLATVEAEGTISRLAESKCQLALATLESRFNDLSTKYDELSRAHLQLAGTPTAHIPSPLRVCLIDPPHAHPHEDPSGD